MAMILTLCSSSHNRRPLTLPQKKPMMKSQKRRTKRSMESRFHLVKLPRTRTVKIKSNTRRMMMRTTRKLRMKRKRERTKWNSLSKMVKLLRSTLIFKSLSNPKKMTTKTSVKLERIRSSSSRAILVVKTRSHQVMKSQMRLTS